MDEPVDMIRTCKGTHEGVISHIYIINIYIYVHKYNMEKIIAGKLYIIAGGCAPCCATTLINPKLRFWSYPASRMYVCMHVCMYVCR